MKGPDETRTKPRRGRRFLVRAGLVLGVLLLATWFLRERIAVWAVRRAASAAGIEIAWQSLELDGLWRVRILGLEARRAPDLDLAADSIEVEFDVLLLARGDLGGLERLSVDRLRGFAGPFPGTGVAQPETAPKPFKLPSALPHVAITTQALEIRLAADRAVAVRDLTLAFDGVAALVKAPSAAWIDGDNRLDYPLDVRGSYARGRFEIERASWDPRVVFEKARVDVDDPKAGLVRFEGGVLAFGGRAQIQGRIEDSVAHVAGLVSHLDLGALVQAWSPDLASEAAGVFDVRVSASVPLGDPLAFECSLQLLARDAHFFRSVDELSGRIVVTTRGIEIADGLVVHGDNAVRFTAAAPPLGTDGCLWLDSLRVWCDGVIGDPRSLLGDDIGLALKSDAPWTRSPLYASAVVAHGDVAAHAWTRAAELGPIIAAFAGEAPATGVIDLEADVKLPLADASRIVVEGVAVAVDAEVLGHALDMAVARVGWSSSGLTLGDLTAFAGANRVEIGAARVPPALFESCSGERIRELFVGNLRANLDDLPALLGGQEKSAGFEALVAHRLEFEGDLAGGEIVLARGLFATNAGVARIERGSIPLQGDFASIVHDPGLDLELALRFEDVAEAVAALAPNAFAPDELPHGAVAGSARIRGRTDGPRAAIVLSARALTVQGVQFDEVDVNAELDERALRIERGDLRGTLGVFTLSGAYVFADQRIIDGKLAADLVDLSRLAPAHLPSGAVQALVRADGRLAAVDGSVSITAGDLVWGGVRIDDLALAGRAVAGEWIIDEARVRGHGLDVALAGRVSSLAPNVAQRKISLETLTIAAADARAALSAPVVIEKNGSRWTVDGLALEGTAGKALLSIKHDGAVSQLEAVLQAPIPRAALELVGIDAGGADVDASISLTRTGHELSGRTSGSIASRDLPPESALHVAWKAELNDRRATIESFVIERGTGEKAGRASVAGNFPLDPLGDEILADGPLALKVSIAAPDTSRLPFVRSAWGAGGGVQLEADLGGAWPAVTGTLTARLDGASLAAVPGVAEVGRVTGSTSLVFGTNAKIDAAEFNIDNTVVLRASGSVDTPLDVRALAHGRVERIRNAAIDLAVRVDADDLAPLAARLPTLRRTRGRVHADVRASGTVATPTFTGEGTLDEGEIRTTTNLPSIVGVSSRVRFDGTHLLIDDLTGEMGGAPFEMQGRIRVLGAAPEIDLKLTGASLLLWREQDVTVRADADLKLAGQLDALVLSGDLALRDGRFTKKFDILAAGKRGPETAGGRGLRLFAFDEAPFSTMRFDVRVTSATPFKISSNLVRGAVSPALSLLGTGALPELRGSILIEPSRVLLPTGSVTVRSGRVNFRPDQPDVPELDIQASARIQGYDIAITVSGSYDDPRIDLTSVPPLSREDLALLLITGTPPGDTLSNSAAQRAAMDLAVYIARDVAVAWLEADEDEVESLAERLEVVVGADTTKSGADAVLVRLRVAGDLQRDRRAMFVTGEKDVYEFYNFGLRFVLAFP